MKKLFIFGVIIFLFVLGVGNVAAQTSPTDTPYPIPTNIVPGHGRIQSSDRLKSKALNAISRRIAEMNQLLVLINGATHVPADKRILLTSQVTNEINTLTSLQTKITKDTDPVTLALDVKELQERHATFALYISKLKIITKAEKAMAVADLLNTLASSLDTKMAGNHANKNYTSLQLLLADMRQKTSDAKVQAQAAIDTVLPLIDEHSTNKTTLLQAKKLLQTAQSSLKLAEKDAKKIVNGLAIPPAAVEKAKRKHHHSKLGKPHQPTLSQKGHGNGRSKGPTRGPDLRGHNL